MNQKERFRENFQNPPVLAVGSFNSSIASFVKTAISTIRYKLGLLVEEGILKKTYEQGFNIFNDRVELFPAIY